MNRPSSILVVALLTAISVALAPATSAAAALDPTAGTTIFPGLAHHELQVRLSDGAPAIVNVLQIALGDTGLELVPVLAQNRVPGLETVPAMGARLLDEGGLAGVNGGFWLGNPLGDPNGYLAAGGALVSESETQGSGPRGTVGVTDTGAVLFDRLDTEVTLTSGALAQPRTVTALNRYRSTSGPYPDGEEPLYLYTPQFGSQVQVTPISAGGQTLPVRVLVVPGLRPPAAGEDAGTVTATAVTSGSVAIPPDGAVVVAHGSTAQQLSGVGPGDSVTVAVEPVPLRTDAQAWRRMTTGLAGGPLIVANGQRTDPSEWEQEGFAPQVHSLVRAPRTAVARTSDGHVLLVTVDGRQPGYSSGMTIAELAGFLLGLGAVEALSVDGGGSTQVAVEGSLRNRPCCDSSLRPVATGLFVRHTYDFANATRLAGPSRDATAAALARASYPDGAPEVLLASADRFPDALAGGPLAAAIGGPLLLTGRDTLPAATADALRDLAPETVTVLGGVDAIAPQVADALATQGYTVRRLAGEDRTATAEAVAAALPARPGLAFVASAGDFPDALTAAAPAGLLGAPVLLTGRDVLAPAARRALVERGVTRVVVAGGEAALGPAVVSQLTALGITVERRGGADRFGTARALNTWAEEELACPEPTETATAELPAAPCLDPGGLVIARGDVFADALAGGPLAAARRNLLTVVPRGDVYANEDSWSYLAERSGELREVVLLGGVAALSSYQHWQLDQLAR